MFFSYYDSYWNDSFIPEQYESDVTKIRSLDYTHHLVAHMNHLVLETWK